MDLGHPLGLGAGAGGEGKEGDPPSHGERHEHRVVDSAHRSVGANFFRLVPRFFYRRWAFRLGQYQLGYSRSTRLIEGNETGWDRGRKCSVSTCVRGSGDD